MVKDKFKLQAKRDKTQVKRLTKVKREKSHVKREFNVSEESSQIRLNKYISNSGICSRREADKLIQSGVIKVNGKVITELGTKINPKDTVEYANQKIKNEKLVYVLLNKPKDFITTMDDPQGRRTVMELVRKACRERIYPVGRLDRNTTGLLLFTNDGDLAKKLIHPKYNVKKIYNVLLDRKLQQNDLDNITEGIRIDDELIKVDDVSYIEEGKSINKREIGIELHSGQNRVVRKIFESLGYNVLKLDRIYFAGLTKKDLPRGKWRFLSKVEIAFLKMGRFK
jgi:23S rRNA pseudouridine2605 synthase